MRNLSLFLFLFLTLLLENANADTLGQVTQPNRYELKQKSSDNYFTIISLKEEGIALFRELDKYNDGKRSYQLILLDNELNEKQNIELEFDNKNISMGYDYAPGELFLLFRKGNAKRNDLELAKISLHDTSLELFEIKPELDLKITHFGILKNSIFLGGYVMNEPSVILYNFIEKQIKMLPGFYQKDTDLIDVRSNLNYTLNVVLFDRALRAKQNLIFRTFDESGLQLLEDIIPVDSEITIHTGLTSSLEREDLALIGTWGYQNAKTASGFYYVSVNPFADQKIELSFLGELDNYLNYLKPKRAKRIKEKALTELKEGKKASLSNHIMPFRVKEHIDGFTVLSEVYTPSSSSNNFSPINPYDPTGYNPYYNPYLPGYYYPGMGRMYSRYQNGQFINEDDEAIRLHESTLISFGPAGNILNDFSVTFDDIRMPSLEQQSDFYYVNSSLSFLTYKKEEEIIVATFDAENKEKNEHRYKVKLSKDLDEFRSEQKKEGGIQSWYENAFYAWGYQTIRNINEEERVRDVFYLTKVVIEK